MVGIACVYSIHNVVDDKYYVGQTVNSVRRFAKHLWELRNNKHHNTHLQNAFNLRGESAFSFEVVRQCEIEELDVWERILIRHYDSFENGYNKEAGGNKFKTFSEESRAKMTKAQLGNKKGSVPCSDDKRLKLHLANKGKKPSPKAVAAVVARCKGSKMSKEQKDKISAGMKLYRASLRAG